MRTERPAARSRWTAVVGTLGIVFGSLGAMSASQVILAPALLDLQRRVFSALLDQARRQEPSNGSSALIAGLLEGLLRPQPPWFAPWCVGLGVALLLISGVCIFGAVWLVLGKRSAPPIFCGALLASLAAGVARVLVLSLAVGPIGLFLGLGGLAGMLIDLVLLVVMLAQRHHWPAPASAAAGAPA